MVPQGFPQPPWLRRGPVDNSVKNFLTGKHTAASGKTCFGEKRVHINLFLQNQ
jgi:hypothetical protein